LKSWWSRTYSRPLKDPLLQEYTLEELYYEYRDHTERRIAAEEQADDAADNIEQQKMDEALSWAAAEEEKESKEDISEVSEADQEWMKSIIEEAKQEYGEDFGENVGVDFDV
jgi:biopolymer transport protein ExbB/TolQ